MTTTYDTSLGHRGVDDEHRYRAVHGKDRRFDGVFYTGVHTTGIYCRPSCPAVTPRRENVSFYPTAAAAQAAGFRACRRCRPDLTPGSPEWDVKADVAGRAMRLIADGVVEREGIAGLAARSGYTPRHLGRVLTEQLGAGPLALARAQRAHTARILIETTEMGFADVAFAAGFASVRQFNATLRDVYAASPTELRGMRRRGNGQQAPDGVVVLSLAVREPFDGAALLQYLAARAVPGMESVSDGSYRRTLRLAHGLGSVQLTPGVDRVECRVQLADLRDLGSAVERCRRLLDLDADPVSIGDALMEDEQLAPWVLKHPGLRVPGHVDGFEVGLRAVIGQQVSVAAARTVLGRLVADYGDSVDGLDEPLHVCPEAQVIADLDPEQLPMPRARGRALVAVGRAVADGTVSLDRGDDRSQVRERLLALPGIGPWTADYIALRALGDPDIFLPTDLGVRHGLARMGIDDARRAEAWRPWRSYALMHVWAAATEESELR